MSNRERENLLFAESEHAAIMEEIIGIIGEEVIPESFVSWGQYDAEKDSVISCCEWYKGGKKQHLNLESSNIKEDAERLLNALIG